MEIKTLYPFKPYYLVPVKSSVTGSGKGSQVLSCCKHHACHFSTKEPNILTLFANLGSVKKIHSYLRVDVHYRDIQETLFPFYRCPQFSIQHPENIIL